MNPTDKFHKKWIKNIARRTSSTRIKRHIINHAKDVSNPRQNNPESWLASMYNLIEIYEEVHETKSSSSRKIYKLLLKYCKHPNYNTPPPGKITKNIHIKRIKEESSIKTKRVNPKVSELKNKIKKRK